MRPCAAAALVRTSIVVVVSCLELAVVQRENEVVALPPQEARLVDAFCRQSPWKGTESVEADAVLEAALGTFELNACYIAQREPRWAILLEKHVMTYM
jgi:hypothetical protein